MAPKGPRKTDFELRRAVGERLRSARNKAGFTLERTAERIGVVRNMVALWEMRTSFPSLENLNKLASLYRVSVDWLMGRAESLADIDIADPDVALFFRKGEWEHFTDEERAFVRGAIKMAMEARKRRELQEGKGKEGE